MDPKSNECIVEYVNVDGSDYTILNLGQSSESSSRLNENKRMTGNYETVEGAFNIEEHRSPAVVEDLATSTVRHPTTNPLEYHVTSFEKSLSTMSSGQEKLLNSFGRRGRPPKTSTPLASGGSWMINLSTTNSLRLNSGGEETTSSSVSDASGNSSTSFFLRVPDNSPVDAYYCNVQNSPLFINQRFPCPAEPDVISTKGHKAGHNETERKRRTRIKNACDELRKLVPLQNDKSDNATVLEATVLFLSSIKQNNPQIFSSAITNSK